MSEWLAIMLEEIDRKSRDAEEEKDEAERRASGNGGTQQQKPDKDSD